MIRTSITVEDTVYDAGQEIAAKRGFRQSFSAYVAWLIMRDAEGGVTREDSTIPNTSTASPKVVRATKRPIKARKAVPHRTSRR